MCITTNNLCKLGTCCNPCPCVHYTGSQNTFPSFPLGSQFFPNASFLVAFDNLLVCESVKSRHMQPMFFFSIESLSFCRAQQGPSVTVVAKLLPLTLLILERGLVQLRPGEPLAMSCMSPNSGSVLILTWRSTNKTRSLKHAVRL